MLWSQGPFAFRDVEGRSLELSEGGKPVYVYNYGLMHKEGAPENRARCCYLHPVYAPDGTVLTDDFPRDHYHHRGISWMWPIVRLEGAQYDLWTLRGIRPQFVRWTARQAGAGSARLGVENGWYVGDRQVVRETVEVLAWPAEAGRRNLDLTLTFEALERPIEIAGEPAEKKGYGGLSLRFAPRVETAIRTDKGAEAQDSNMAPHAWAELEALFEGRRAGARVTIDRSHPGFPNGWCLRHYGFLGVNYPGLDSYTLAPGRPLVLKYRVTVSSSPR
jgi:hypothetical protein